jgi:hypothetical protein
VGIDLFNQYPTCGQVLQECYRHFQPLNDVLATHIVLVTFVKEGRKQCLTLCAVLSKVKPDWTVEHSPICFLVYINALPLVLLVVKLQRCTVGCHYKTTGCKETLKPEAFASSCLRPPS